MINGERLISRPLRWAMVGGGRTGQVGYKHRTGALRDGNYQLVAGAFDLDAERGRDFGVNLGVAAERCYADYKALIAGETAREDGVDVVSIATPISPIMRSPRPASKPGCMSSARNRCSSPWRNAMKWRGSPNRRA